MHSLFDHSEADAERDRADRARDREEYLQAQMTRALASRARMHALGFELAVDMVEQGITVEDLLALYSEAP